MSADDRQLMSAAIAANLQRTFFQLMQRPARIGDIEYAGQDTPPEQSAEPIPPPDFVPF